MKKNVIVSALAFVAVFGACKKEDVNNPDPIAPAKGVYVLSEGGFGANNAKIAYRSAASGTVSQDYFLQQNPTETAGLGDVGNDMIVYGGKIYIVMNGSGNVTVLNAQTGTLLSKVSFRNASGNRNPRYAVGAGGKVYVTAYDATVSAIDTTTFTITKTINVGPNPEGIAAAGNFLYVANSGGFNPVPDSTVSVINMTTGTEVKKITVGVNPNRIAANTAGDLYVTAYGNFTSIPASVSVISSTTQALKTTLGTGFQYSHLVLINDVAYFFNNYGGAGTAKVFNTLTSAVVRNEFITDGTVITTPYGINVDEQNGDVYITDAKDYVSSGEVTCFGSDGKKKFSFSVAPGVNPNKVLFAR
jgi:YVTN family beta-propeller protein